MRRRGGLATVLIALLAVSGCASIPGEQTHPEEQALPDDLFAAARQSEIAPEGFDEGPSRTPCGEVTLGQGEQLPTNAVDCIDAAIGSMDAELAVVSPTTEGDPIVTFYRTAAGAPGVEKFTDAEFDRYGPKTWTHENCPQTTTVISLQGCSEI
jgi:hypothetical protein